MKESNSSTPLTTMQRPKKEKKKMGQQYRKRYLSLCKKSVLKLLWSLKVSHEDKYEYIMKNKQSVVNCIRSCCAENRIPSVSLDDLVLFIRKMENQKKKRDEKKKKRDEKKATKGETEMKKEKKSTGEVNYFIYILYSLLPHNVMYIYIMKYVYILVFEVSNF
jgi:hypothetical protein